MSKIALVTLDDMPPLALGEFQLSDDFETLFAGVGDVAEGGTGGGGGGVRPNVPSGTSPVQIKSGIFTRLAVKNGYIDANLSGLTLGCAFSRNISFYNNNIDAPNIGVNLTLREV